MRGSTWLAGLVVAIGLLSVPATGAAHAQLRSAEPTPGLRLTSAPTSVRLVFSAGVEQGFLSLTVTGPGGRTVSGPGRRDPRDAGAIVASVRSPERGVLTVRWRVLSQDGHPAGGAYTLGVRTPAGSAGPAGVIRSDNGPLPLLARLLGLVAPLGLVGLVTLAAGIVAPSVRAGGIVVPGEPSARRGGFLESVDRALERSASGWWRAWWALVGAGALGLALAPLAVLWGLREGLGELGPLLGGTRFGAGWWTQAVALAAVAAASVLVRRTSGRWRLPDGPAAAVMLGGGPLLALAAISWSGHASVGGDARANIVIDLLHTAATAVWIGGLLGLAVLVTPAVARLGLDDRVRFAAAVVVRFSTLALAAIVVLVVTGVYRALAEVSVGRLTDTGYGRALLVKLALFAILLIGGAYNRMIVHPRLERAALGLAPDDRGAASALRVSVRAELVVACLLLVSVAALVSLPPPA